MHNAALGKGIDPSSFLGRRARANDLTAPLSLYLRDYLLYKHTANRVIQKGLPLFF